MANRTARKTHGRKRRGACTALWTTLSGYFVRQRSDRLARFRREAHVLASLNHLNIAHIHGLEDSGGVRALVIELVEGEDLAQRLTREPIALQTFINGLALDSS